MVLSVLSKSCPRGRCATQKEWSEEQEWGEDGMHCLLNGTLIPLVIGVPSSISRQKFPVWFTK